MNWNSKTGEFTQVVKEKTIALKKQVQHDRFFHHMSVKNIAKWNGISTSRVYELLR